MTNLIQGFQPPMDFQIWVSMVLALAVIIPVVILIARLVDNAW